ncbi:energy transducer TonB [Hymenobacter sp. DH14]|uniref:Energy transducer TonB n=1 Tax=Hymenobacter cyanobacteriorum TaxID=2926463 RepID=A0A9X2AGH3_9BACT|nr:energy transducer TonB [Hymenobacter cyanobacteriorum]MCI1185844.1 energy transducer TonB [Hymenobacter cyanobacteriorum]
MKFAKHVSAIAPLALGLLLAAAAPALAQTPKTPAPQPDQGAGSVGAGKTIPVAEYYEGGQTAMYDFIAKEMVYPVMARRNRIQGQCIISFQLNADGTMQDMRIVKQLGGGTGEEALRVVKLLKFKKPELPIRASLPITFKLTKPGSNVTE